MDPVKKMNSSPLRLPEKDWLCILSLRFCTPMSSVPRSQNPSVMLRGPSVSLTELQSPLTGELHRLPLVLLMRYDDFVARSTLLMSVLAGEVCLPGST